MKLKECRYIVKVDVLDNECLTLQGKESWPDDEYESDAKSIGEIIINSANYYAAKVDVHWSYFDRVLWVEPPRPNQK